MMSHPGTLNLIYNLFQSNQASMGGVFALLDKNIILVSLKNLFLYNKARGDSNKYLDDEYIYLNISNLIPRNRLRLGSTFFLLESINNSTFQENIVKERFLVSFWHEVIERRIQPLSNNTFKFKKVNIKNIFPNIIFNNNYISLYIY